MVEPKPKTRRVSYFILLVLGGLGGHRFYLRRVRSGLALLGYTLSFTIIDNIAFAFFPDVEFFSDEIFFGVAVIALWIFLLTDAFKIPRWVNEFNQKDSASVFS